MRLFSALWPPQRVVTALRAAVRAGPPEAGLRWSPEHQWHITLGFYGEDDPGARAASLRARLRGAAAVPLRLAGAGMFPGVLWAGVAGDELHDLAVSIGAEDAGRPYHPHLTLARWQRTDRAGTAAAVRWVAALAELSGPAWTADRVALVRSDGGKYTVVEQFHLG
ncbi:RNA 2',3'-cyclic phosphodiesterase [Amycolatopsis suaedae]|uniref:RNA 2',3'-cyclic phosphodiesterase n=1 Tax=Amycolatopsis suaedae TaxID=2510978 RepID=A0A4Q7IZ75_9PSEU|nr:RNA 2',3'-cyclic phosphodiesterase [Amycolatopsis suaedae]RZQ59779.1 RNA 2',3'-cyclic phosphodiesterase [Amycolatopsis suaedae]